jgi:hypothetical protein
MARRSIAALILLTLSVGVAAQDQQQAPRKLTDAQRREIQAIVKILDGAAPGATLPNDLSLTWIREDVLKAQGNKQYVPFTVTLDASKTTAKELTVYWRVVDKAQAAAAPAPANSNNNRNEKPAQPPAYAYEDLNNAVVTPGQSGPQRVSRAFTVNPGNYDVLIVIKEPTSTQRNAPAPKVSVIRQPLEIPDFWNGELATSTVIVAERIDPLPAPLTPQQQIERPYALGNMEIIPAAATTFAKKAELATFLLIYNAKTDAANKPDVSVEYNFYTKQGGAEKFFNKTNPQNLNAQTLPPQFDFAAGHQLQSGQAVPLASFPEGDYRLEITVTDKLANKTLKKDVNFTVAGS